jgi:hypothetical protein
MRLAGMNWEEIDSKVKPKKPVKPEPKDEEVVAPKKEREETVTGIDGGKPEETIELEKPK